MKFSPIFSAVLLLGLCASCVRPSSQRDAALERRVEKTLASMTLDEKVAQMRHIHHGHYNVDGAVDASKLLASTDGLGRGCVEAFPYSLSQYRQAVYDIQATLADSTRLGIPAIPILEGLHGIVQDGCTVFPQSIALASTFDTELMERVASCIGSEARAIGARQVLAPDLDLARDPRWGRVEETYGEDPFLVGEMGAAYVRGMNSQGVISTLKHYVAHGTPQSGLNLASVHGGERDLYDLYLLPFRRAMRENPLSVMNCYSIYDGEAVTASRRLLTDVLRGELGFKGYVYSDWGSIGMLMRFHHVAASEADGARMAIEAGLDLESGSNFYATAADLVRSGALDEKYIDQAVRNILYTKAASGVWDDPVPAADSCWMDAIHSTGAVALSLEAALRSAVLLENDGILPLSKDLRVALVGPQTTRVQYGDYSWTQDPASGVTPLEGLRAAGFKVDSAEGCDLWSQDRSGFGEAVKLARRADVAVVCVGSQSMLLSRPSDVATCGEGYDVSSLKLPGVQEELVEAVAATGTPVVLVLVTGRPFELERLRDRCSAIVLQWYGGERQGEALAELLGGDADFSGRLPVSFPKSTGQLPCYYNYYPSDKGFYNAKGRPDVPGRDYVFSDPYALYPFGYGLSYAQFGYSGFEASLSEDGTLQFDFTVENLSQRDGRAVPQVYMRDEVSSVSTPVSRLVAFGAVDLKAGESRRVCLNADIRQLSLHNAEMQEVVEAGDFAVWLASSSSSAISGTTLTLEKDIFIGRPFGVSARRSASGRRSARTAGVKAGPDDDAAMRSIGQVQ